MFQIATAAHIIDFASQVVRAIHVGFLMLLTFPLVAAARQAGAAAFKTAGLGCWPGLGVVVALYQWVEYTELLLRAGDPLTRDIVLGVIALSTVFLAAWVNHGAGAADHLRRVPAPIACSANTCRRRSTTRGYDFAQVIDHMAYGTEGIYGIPIFVSSSFIFPLHPVRRLSLRRPA